MADIWKLLATPVKTPTETLVDGTVDFYNPGTTGESNRKDVYTDAAGTIVAANPYTLDSDATAVLYGSGLYHVIIKDSSGNTEYDLDFITPDKEVYTFTPATLAELQAITGYPGATANLLARTTLGDGGGGPFYWNSSDLSAQVAADEVNAGEGDGGYFVAPAADKTGASGAWVFTDQKIISPLRYSGLSLTNGTDDWTTAVTKAHTYANSLGLPVSYAGITKMAIQADAQIPLKTNTDFSNVKIYLLGGIEADPTAGTENKAYIVSDDDAPLVSVTGAVSAGDLIEGSYYPTRGLFDDHGYAFLSCALQVSNRDLDGTTDYTQSFKVNRNGRVSLPLSTDLQAHAADISIDYRKTSLTRLHIDNVSLIEETWNHQAFFWIERCNVEINGFAFLPETFADYQNSSDIINIQKSSDITINDYISTARPNVSSTSSYNLGIYGGADIRVNGMDANGDGWGATGTNWVNGLYFSDSTINRVDAHESGHNVFVDNCDVHKFGCTYGWGGGLYSIKNSRLHNCSALYYRGDYGGSFFGDIVVDNCEMLPVDSPFTIVDLRVNASLGSDVAETHAPTSIRITNIKYPLRGFSLSSNFFSPLEIGVRDGSAPVYAPASVTIDNIDYGDIPTTITQTIEWLNMEQNPNVSTTKFNVRGVSGTAPGFIKDGAVQGAITATADAGGGQITVTSASHGLSNGDSVIVTGTTDYDGEYTISNVAAGTFEITDTFTSNQAGLWFHVENPASSPVALDFKIFNSKNIAVYNMMGNAPSIYCFDSELNAVVVTRGVVQPRVSLNNCQFLTKDPNFSVVPVVGAFSSNARFSSLDGCEFSDLVWDLRTISCATGTIIRDSSPSNWLIHASATNATMYTGFNLF